jgi:hypothetical protein
LAGNDWGRQAFIGNLDSPLLPTLGLLAANLVSKFLGGNPALAFVLDIPSDSGRLLCQACH